MDLQTAKQNLHKSITNLQSRRNELTMADIEAEVINNACLDILKNKDLSNANKYAQAYAQAGMALIPQYSEKHAMNAQIGIPQNVNWDGMWDFLRDYFQKNHGIEIDNVETTPNTFYSSRHERYENNNLVSESEVDRTININFLKDNEEIIVGIAPSLSPKKALRISKNERQEKFKGTDPDYLFTINYDDFDEIDNFVLEMPNRGLKIVYFE